MDMDLSNGHHHQEMSMENIVGTKSQQENKKPRPQPEQALNCPRCDSTNTKFCYYNNYSLSQPRYFCKSCRRYWTKGGALRNVPVGGGCRKNKRPSSSSATKRIQDQPLISSSSIPNYDSSDLTLAFARLQRQNGQLGFDDNNTNLSILGHPNPSFNFLEALETQNQSIGKGFDNMFYGYENENVGEVDNNEIRLPYEEMSGATTPAVTVATMKQEGDYNKVLWGFPWQLNNGDGSVGEIDSGRESWNGFVPSWHGLLNSPLM